EKSNDAQPASTAYDLVATEEQINRKYCGSSVCKFLFPFSIREQESRARLQVPGLIIMAQQTNRVLVLPNVGDARLGSCKSFTFDYYYSVESMRQSAPNTTFITQDHFLQWNQEMKAIKAKKYTTKIVELSNAVGKEYIGSNQLDLKRYRKKECLLPFDHLEYETNATLDLHIARKTGDQFVIDALQSVQSDVILIRYTAYKFNYSLLKYQPASLT
ncbi:8692_t:CDS:1, partial [Paraglomus occultum]